MITRLAVQVQPFAVASQQMRIDGYSMDNLEIVRGPDGTAEGSLLEVMDHCRSAGGRRLLRAWLCRPLCSAHEIAARQRAVAALQGAPLLLQELQVAMQRHPDLPRCACQRLPLRPGMHFCGSPDKVLLLICVLAVAVTLHLATT